jgi:ubiquitin C-terminal hydrolase
MLCVHLQRGYWANGQGRKNMAEVKFQTTLNLTNYMQVEDYLVYELYAIVEHWGSTLNSGHYVTYARDEKYFDMPNKWKLINDATVTERLQLKDVKQGQTNHTPYLLFYTRKQIP